MKKQVIEGLVGKIIESKSEIDLKSVQLSKNRFIRSCCVIDRPYQCLRSTCPTH